MVEPGFGFAGATGGVNFTTNGERVITTDHAVGLHNFVAAAWLLAGQTAGTGSDLQQVRDVRWPERAARGGAGHLCGARRGLEGTKQSSRVNSMCTCAHINMRHNHG